MPRRSNLHQAAVFYVKVHYARPDATVTESKMLYDPEAGTYREVDVVLEQRIGDVPVVVSIEVVKHSRPKDLTWVDQMVGKHAALPTSTLVLVSWSGFSAPAARKIAVRPNVIGLVPEEVPGTVTSVLDEAENPKISRFIITPETAVIETDHGPERVAIDVNLYAGPSHDLLGGTLREQVLKLIKEKGIGERLMEQAIQRGDRDLLTRFTVGDDDMARQAVYVHHRDDDQFRLLTAFKVTGRFAMIDLPVPEFTVMAFRDVGQAELGGEIFALSEVEHAGEPAVWILTSEGLLTFWTQLPAD